MKGVHVGFNTLLQDRICDDMGTSLASAGFAAGCWSLVVSRGAAAKLPVIMSMCRPELSSFLVGATGWQARLHNARLILAFQ